MSSNTKHNHVGTVLRLMHRNFITLIGTLQDPWTDSLSPCRLEATSIIPMWHRYLPGTSSHQTWSMMQFLSTFKCRYIEQLIYQSTDDPQRFISKSWQIIQLETGNRKGPMPRWFASLQSM